MDICAYKLITRGDNSPWVILIHGLFGNSDNLKGLAQHLSVDFNLCLIDLPNHGQSPTTSQFCFSEQSQMIIDTLDHLNIKQAHFVGHSLGGKFSMWIALHFPHYVQSLVVADIAPVAYPPRHDAVFAALNAVDFNKINNRRDVSSLFAELLSDQGTQQFLLKGLNKAASGQWHWQFNLTLLERDYHKLIDWPNSSEVADTSTLFIKGAQSDYITTEHQPAIIKQFPHAQAHIIEGAGHWLHAQKPAVFNRIVTRFLQKSH